MNVSTPVSLLSKLKVTVFVLLTLISFNAQAEFYVVKQGPDMILPCDCDPCNPCRPCKIICHPHRHHCRHHHHHKRLACYRPHHYIERPCHHRRSCYSISVYYPCPCYTSFPCSDYYDGKYAFYSNESCEDDCPCKLHCDCAIVHTYTGYKVSHSPNFDFY